MLLDGQSLNSPNFYNNKVQELLYLHLRSHMLFVIHFMALVELVIDFISTEIMSVDFNMLIMIHLQNTQTSLFETLHRSGHWDLVQEKCS